MGRKYLHRRIQPRFEGKKRQKLQPKVERAIASAVERDAIRWGCSKSWIVATALAAFYDIDIITPYMKKSKDGKAA